MNTYHVIGLMSGTSLDGLDVAACTLVESSGQWSYQWQGATTYAYSEEWKQKLQVVHTLSALELARCNADLGKLHGQWICDFIATHQPRVEFIASHGHTVFHQPDQGFTTQIGCPAQIAATTGLPVVADFRSLDVALGGQGAPLVPIGDRYLFTAFESCLNLGGVANLSIKSNQGYRAFDIAICNMALNFLSEKKGMPYDRDGHIAAVGSIDPLLLHDLNAIPFFQLDGPKSLGKEFFEHYYLPLIDTEKCTIEDRMRTVVEHIAMQIARVIPSAGNMLVTGGGALNLFLISRIQELSSIQLTVPDIQTIQFKEALIFALLGVLRWRGEVNSLAQVTGAKCDSVGGAIYLPR